MKVKVFWEFGGDNVYVYPPDAQKSWRLTGPLAVLAGLRRPEDARYSSPLPAGIPAPLGMKGEWAFEIELSEELCLLLRELARLLESHVKALEYESRLRAVRVSLSKGDIVAAAVYAELRITSPGNAVCSRGWSDKSYWKEHVLPYVQDVLKHS